MSNLITNKVLFNAHENCKKNQMNTEIDDMRDGVESAEEDDKSATDFVQIDVVIQR